ncbi:hypothetical protein KUTeg_016498, partial [Tegillarca granosa]
LNTEFIPDDCFRYDVKVDQRRHIIFATDQQIEFLGKFKTIYVDGTFKLVRKPFTQLLTFHAFIRSCENLKQPSVTSFVTDFEKGIWKGIQKAFSLPIHGFVFHWSQAVWRKVQSLGLQVAYNKRDDIHKLIRKLFSLPLLPAEHIPDAFEELFSGSHPTQIVELLNYIHDNWMTSSVWTVSLWSVFNMSVRTNNDVERWHRRINDRAHGSANVPFYLLIQLLHREAKCLPTQVKLICEGKLKRVQRKSTLKLFKKLHSLWNAYENGEVSTSQFLKRCGRIYAPMT